MMTRATKNEYFYSLIDKMISSIEDDLNHHAICEHEWCPDSHLLARMRTERKNGVSCFSKDINVREAMIDAIYDATELMPWVCSSMKDDLCIIQDCENCGKKYTCKSDWVEGKAITCNKYKVVIGKRFDKAGCLVELFPKSSYPI